MAFATGRKTGWPWAKSRWLALVFGGLMFAIVGIFILDRLFPPPIDKIKISTIITDRNGAWLHAFTIDDDGERRWRLKAELEDIDPVFIERLIAIEDKRFWDHKGVDPIAVLRAMRSMLASGEIVSGASTITMQTARLLEPRPRNLGSKFVEMLRALQLEARLSKHEILELYLTYTPYGGNLEGVRAASIAYFGKEPGALNDAEQALLIALPQAPEARRPDRRPQNARIARAEILSKLKARKLIKADLFAEAKAAPVPINRKPFPRQALHAAYELRRQAEGGDVRSTLDKNLQSYGELLAQEFSATSGDDASMAILVIENQSGAVRVHVGSAGTNLQGGWIDMTRALRSPGSTLKPFIYGIAFDDGMASTKTLIDDAPYTFGTYRPENFTRAFHGDVSVEEALQHSLNVPAVLALDQIGPRRFVSLMEGTGVTMAVPKRADDKASLAIALGGVGVSGRDLATLYRALANDGQVKPLFWREAMTDEKAYQFLTPQTANRIGEIMRMAPAPQGRAPSALSVSAPKVAFKTGTSYGYRDGWSAGFTDRYTVIVWTGHANGTPRPGVTGREAALPALFAIFDRLQSAEEISDLPIAAYHEGEFATGTGLARMTPRKASLPPEIVFPENGVELLLTERAKEQGFVFSARGGAGPYQWYVDGKPVRIDSLQKRPVWRPSEGGFYKVTVVDQRGIKAHSDIILR